MHIEYEGINMDREKLNIGNVNFDKDSVLCSKYVYEKGQKLNYVFLVGGTKMRQYHWQRITTAKFPKYVHGLTT